MELSLPAQQLYKYSQAGAGEQGRVREGPLLPTAPPSNEMVAWDVHRQVAALAESHMYRPGNGHGLL